MPGKFRERRRPYRASSAASKSPRGRLHRVSTKESPIEARRPTAEDRSRRRGRGSLRSARQGGAHQRTGGRAESGHVDTRLTAESRVEPHGKAAAVVIERDGQDGRRTGSLEGRPGVHVDLASGVGSVSGGGGGQQAWRARAGRRATAAAVCRPGPGQREPSSSRNEKKNETGNVNYALPMVVLLVRREDRQATRSLCIRSSVRGCSGRGVVVG